MKRLILLAGIWALLSTAAQAVPLWISNAWRESNYPVSEFFTGFASEHLKPDMGVDVLTERAKQDAQKNLSENIRLRIKSETHAQDRSSAANGNEQLSSRYEATIQSSSDVEVAGLKTDTYYDASSRVAYAFAYVKRSDLAAYYKVGIATAVRQIEGLLRTAEQLESSGEKAKARVECERTQPLFAKLREMQNLLVAVDASDSKNLQQNTTEALRSKASQMQARLAQGVYVYVESSEEICGTMSDILSKKIKAILAQNGCSFTDSAAQADLVLKMKSTTRSVGEPVGSIAFCYADIAVELYSNVKQKTVFSDEISQKGGGATPERAGRKAMEDAADKVATELMPWIKN